MAVDPVAADEPGKDGVVDAARRAQIDVFPTGAPFHHLPYGFRPERSVHHAVRTVKLQVQDGTDTTRGRWIIEGDLASYLDRLS
ncbi:hypothetical protein [Mesorhizobium sp. M0085]|uniref:hypothetical protein n=1 Tax=Mesorhizobium sp. M0085 TaxID=2956872 RepID=UPI003334B57F